MPGPPAGMETAHGRPLHGTGSASHGIPGEREAGGDPRIRLSGKPLNCAYTFCCGSVGGRKPCSPYWMLRVLRLVRVAGRLCWPLFWRRTVFPGLPLAPEARGAAQGDAGGRLEGRERSRACGCVAGTRGRRVGIFQEEGQLWRVFLPRCRGVLWGAERSRPLSSADRPRSRLGSAGGGCG